MTSNYFPPTFNQSHFHCPYCGVNAKQNWYSVYTDSPPLSEYKVSSCTHCSKNCMWYDKKMIIPTAANAPMPHEDIPASLTADFNEAREIVNFSPRGAAALLRLVLQKLMIELGESGKDINKDIGSLVNKGLPEEIQQALDIVRVIGNESVHPGELDLHDDTDTALQLFELINFIIEERISRKKRISSLFSRLPEGKLKGIEARDKDKPVEV